MVFNVTPRFQDHLLGGIVTFPVYALMDPERYAQDPRFKFLRLSNGCRDIQILFFRIKNLTGGEIILLHQTGHAVKQRKHVQLLLSDMYPGIIHACHQTVYGFPDFFLRAEFHRCDEIIFIRIIKFQFAAAYRFYIIDINRLAHTDNTPVAQCVHRRLVHPAEIGKLLAAVSHRNGHRDLQNPPALLTDISQVIQKARLGIVLINGHNQGNAGR